MTAVRAPLVALLLLGLATGAGVVSFGFNVSRLGFGSRAFGGDNYRSRASSVGFREP